MYIRRSGYNPQCSSRLEVYAAITARFMVKYGLLFSEIVRNSDHPPESFIDYEKLKTILRPAKSCELSAEVQLAPKMARVLDPLVFTQSDELMNSR